jgi:beta-galactosidase/beta-glucuronidase
VDDLYELFVNGRLASKRGDLATRQDTFNERFSHDLTGLVEAGREAVIAVRVHDWYGAGGIFRPVTLSTTPLREGDEVIK